MPYFLVDYVYSRQMETKAVHEEVILKVSFAQAPRFILGDTIDPIPF